MNQTVWSSNFGKYNISCDIPSDFEIFLKYEKLTQGVKLFEIYESAFNLYISGSFDYARMRVIIKLNGNLIKDMYINSGKYIDGKFSYEFSVEINTNNLISDYVNKIELILK